MIHRAGQHGSGQQAADIGVGMGTRQQRMVGFRTFENDMTVFLEQILHRGRTRGLGLRLVVLEQCAVGRTAHQHRQFVIAQPEITAIAASGLQGERAQAQRIAHAQADLWLCQCVQDARVGECLARAGGSHVDDEGPMFRRCFAQAGGCIEGFVLPCEPGVAAALAQATMMGEAWQVAFEVRQCVCNQACVVAHADQVFQQRLVALGIAALVLAGIGKYRLVRLHEALALDDGIIVAVNFEAGIVMVGQHQAQPGQVHDVGISQPVAAAPCLQFQ